MNDTIRPTLATLAANTAAYLVGLNAKYGGNTTKTFAVGKSGSSCHGSTGAKTHIIITTIRTVNSPGHHLHGKTLTDVASPCNSTDRRQASFSIIEGFDTDKVTCTKCLKWLGV